MAKRTPEIVTYTLDSMKKFVAYAERGEELKAESTLRNLDKKLGVWCDLQGANADHQVLHQVMWNGFEGLKFEASEGLLPSSAYSAYGKSVFRSVRDAVGRILELRHTPKIRTPGRLPPRELAAIPCLHIPPRTTECKLVRGNVIASWDAISHVDLIAVFGENLFRVLVDKEPMEGNYTLCTNQRLLVVPNAMTVDLLPSELNAFVGEATNGSESWSLDSDDCSPLPHFTQHCAVYWLSRPRASSAGRQLVSRLRSQLVTWSTIEPK